ncbi:helix-turn-helix domain-containing protein [Ruminococcus albus]|nr:helix-turn-helix domain-containing protein [Ruminococcus albus]MCC3351622.1 helix-turn-helix domain-containing protein [Ruminococcus albus 8]
MKTTEYMTIAEAAELLHVSKQKVASIIKSGELKVIELGPRSRRIPKAGFEEYIKNKTT